MRHLRDIDRSVHCDSGSGLDYTLCGLAPEGENGDTPMEETSAPIDCKECVGIIALCRRINPKEVACKLPHSKNETREKVGMNFLESRNSRRPRSSAG